MRTTQVRSTGLIQPSLRRSRQYGGAWAHFGVLSTPRPGTDRRFKSPSCRYFSDDASSNAVSRERDASHAAVAGRPSGPIGGAKRVYWE